MNMKHNNLTHLAGVLAVAGLLGSLAGCRDDRESAPPRQFFPDMDDAPKWKPQTKSEFFADGRSMRRPVAGTVPFSRVNFAPNLFHTDARPDWAAGYDMKRAELLKDGDNYYEGKGSDGLYIDRIPVEVTKEMLLKGQEKFNIFCAVCHGFTGDGKGVVGAQWSYPLPTYHDEKYKKPDPRTPGGQIHKDGYLFHTALYGVFDVTGAQKMPGYKHALSEHDAWSVVAYIRALQRTHEGVAADVPEAQRQILERNRPPLVSPPADQPAPSTGGQP